MPFFPDLTWLFTTSSTGCGFVFIDKYLVYIRTIWNFESRGIVVSEVRHLWNCLIAELDSRNESSSLAKIGTFDDSCIAFHSGVRWQIGGSVRARDMVEIYYLPRKPFTDRTDGRLYQDTEKIPLSSNPAQPIDRRKAAFD